MLIRSLGLWLAATIGLAVPASQDGNGRAIHDASVKIGLLLHDDAELSAAVRRAVYARVQEVNAAGGIRGRMVEVVERSTGGLWGAGTSEIVRTVFDDDVLGVIGGLDGRSAHLIEQVTAKARVALISPWASDPTLSAAFVPWFFRMVPSDRQQAEALWDELSRRGCKHVVMLVADDYDSRKAAAAFERAGAEIGVRLRIRRRLDVGEPLGIPTDVDAVAVFAPPAEGRAAMQELADDGYNRLFVTGLRAGSAYASAGSGAPGNLLLVHPDIGGQGEMATPPDSTRDDGTAGVAAAYAYDASLVLLHAIERAGSNRATVRDFIASVSLEGTTGRVAFDAMGNRINPVGLAELASGGLESLEPYHP